MALPRHRGHDGQDQAAVKLWGKSLGFRTPKKAAQCFLRFSSAVFLFFLCFLGGGVCVCVSFFGSVSFCKASQRLHLALTVLAVRDGFGFGMVS